MDTQGALGSVLSDFMPPIAPALPTLRGITHYRPRNTMTFDHSLPRGGLTRPETGLLLGAAAGALYTLSLVRAGKTFNGQKLIMINALFGFFWSAGSVAGPVVSGMLIGITGYDGLIVTLVASGVLFLLIQCLCKNEKTLLASEQEDDMDEATESAR